MASNGNFYQVRILTILSPQIGLNILHYDVTATVGTGATDAQIALGFDNLFAATYKVLPGTAVTYRGVGIRRIYPTQGLEVVSIANSGACSGGTNLAPFQAAPVIHFQTGTAGRKGRGRIYIPFISVSALQASGELSAGYLASLAALATNLLAAPTFGAGGNTNTLNPCIYHRATSNIDFILAAYSTGKIGTQRRRGDYGRVNAAPF